MRGVGRCWRHCNAGPFRDPGVGRGVTYFALMVFFPLAIVHAFFPLAVLRLPGVLEISCVALCRAIGSTVLCLATDPLGGFPACTGCGPLTPHQTSTDPSLLSSTLLCLKAKPVQLTGNVDGSNSSVSRADVNLSAELKEQACSQLCSAQNSAQTSTLTSSRVRR